jgi:hypothetical protein
MGVKRVYKILRRDRLLENLGFSIMPGLMVTFSFMTKHNAMLGRILYCYAECHLDKCHYVECRYAPSAIVLCRCWTDCHYAECCSL